jgi:hypothetical protein
MFLVYLSRVRPMLIPALLIYNLLPQFLLLRPPWRAGGGAQALTVFTAARASRARNAQRRMQMKRALHVNLIRALYEFGEI